MFSHKHFQSEVSPDLKQIIKFSLPLQTRTNFLSNNTLYPADSVVCRVKSRLTTESHIYHAGKEKELLTACLVTALIWMKVWFHRIAMSGLKDNCKQTVNAHETRMNSVSRLLTLRNFTATGQVCIRLYFHLSFRNALKNQTRSESKLHIHTSSHDYW